MQDGRSPHGECGLKSETKLYNAPDDASLPTRGVWIEILDSQAFLRSPQCRSPHGECGLKFGVPILLALDAHVAPHTGSVD